jgi:hypothetical protein
MHVYILPFKENSVLFGSAAVGFLQDLQESKMVHVDSYDCALSLLKESSVGKAQPTITVCHFHICMEFQNNVHSKRIAVVDKVKGLFCIQSQ